MTHVAATNGVPTDAANGLPEVAKGDLSLDGTHDAKTAWDDPGPAAFDLRSDTTTSPTAGMLIAIRTTTLLDDVFLEDPVTNSLQSFIAELTGHEDALLVTSGTQGNQLAIRAALNCAPPYSVVVDARSHIYGWEAGGAGWISGALVRPVAPSNGHHLTLEDIKGGVILGTGVHATPTRLVCLENTLAGTVMPLGEIKRISQWCREIGVHLHCDGARLWEAVAADVAEREGQQKLESEEGREQLKGALRARLKESAQCFGSVSLCYSKGLGAPIGSVLVSSKAFIRRARHCRTSMGGGMRQAGIISAPARFSVEETFLGGKLAASHARARDVAGIWEKAGGKLQAGKPVETNMVWCDLESLGVDVEGFVRACKEEGLRVMGGRLVVHYQIQEPAVQRWRAVCEKLKKGRKDGGADGEGSEAKKMKLNVE